MPANSDEKLLRDAQEIRKTGAAVIQRAREVCAESRSIIALIIQNELLAPHERHRPSGRARKI